MPQHRSEIASSASQVDAAAPGVQLSHHEPRARGKVYLVGAGPGDPELLTVKGLRCLRAADVVVYDRLVSVALLDEVPTDALRIFVGKQPGRCSLGQEEINALLIEHARLGSSVVRLKGGDPFVFGRGGEEALALVEAGVAFEVVPGISSAIAVPAYAGIPVTHRNHSGVLTIVTGHETPEHSAPLVDWEGLARLDSTLVILMGVATLSWISTRLLQAGMDPNMPVAVIEQGTIARQRVVSGSLTEIAEQVITAGVRSPAVIVIGRVVNLSPLLSWFAPSAQEEARSSH
ncbi:MAG TPA: uroporphyrinogen-III C-methyltransferase [Ktedonobacteraceae bacterium]